MTRRRHDKKEAIIPSENGKRSGVPSAGANGFQ
jgi:hypothetical protein